MQYATYYLSYLANEEGEKLHTSRKHKNFSSFRNLLLNKTFFHLSPLHNPRNFTETLFPFFLVTWTMHITSYKYRIKNCCCKSFHESPDCENLIFFLLPRRLLVLIPTSLWLLPLQNATSHLEHPCLLVCNNL